VFFLLLPDHVIISDYGKEIMCIHRLGP